jgi:hypothetical protein
MSFSDLKSLKSLSGIAFGMTEGAAAPSSRVLPNHHMPADAGVRPSRYHAPAESGHRSAINIGTEHSCTIWI